jgi:hypothetical protein
MKTKYTGIFMSLILSLAFTYQGLTAHNQATDLPDKPSIVLSTMKQGTLTDLNSGLSDVSLPEEPLHTEPEREGSTKTDSEPQQAKPKVTLPDKKIASRSVRNNTPVGYKPDPVADAPQPAPPPQPEPELPVVPSPNLYDTDLNNYVLNVILNYVGSYPYLLNNDYANYNGVTENLFFGGRLLAKAHPSGNRASHCSGITFEVFFKAMQARNHKLGLDPNDFNGMSFTELSDFLQIWYVASGNKQTNNIEIAVEKYGIGKRIGDFEEAKRGDFIDFSRSNGTGHTVVFLNWVRENGKIIGLHYWSSQSSTNGISEKTEYFDISGRGNVISNQIYIARVLPVHQYKSFR